MDNLVADFTININEPLQAEFVLGNSQTFDCSFELFASGTVWGSIDGDISDQTDLQNALGLKADSSYVESVTGALADSIQIIDSTIDGFGDIVTYNAADFATSAQGALADTAIQPNDNISELNNDAGYITSASLPTVNDGTLTIQVNSTDVGTFSANQSTNETINILVPDSATWGNITGDIDDQTDLKNALSAKYDASNPDGFISGINSSDVTNALGYTPYNSTNPNGYITSADLPTLEDLTTQAQINAINSGATSVNIAQIASNTQAISTETLNRQNADNGLQSQIDAIVASSDVFDIVGTYAELQAYDIATVPPNDIIKVLVDSTHNNAATYYRCIEINEVKSWSYIGSEGAYYTKGEADSTFVPQTRTVNNKALSNNITLTASDVGALASDTVIPTVNNSTITLQQNGTTVDSFTLNQASNKTINIETPDDYYTRDEIDSIVPQDVKTPVAYYQPTTSYCYDENDNRFYGSRISEKLYLVQPKTSGTTQVIDMSTTFSLDFSFKYLGVPATTFTLAEIMVSSASGKGVLLQVTSGGMYYRNNITSSTVTGTRSLIIGNTYDVRVEYNGTKMVISWKLSTDANYTEINATTCTVSGTYYNYASIGSDGDSIYLPLSSVVLVNNGTTLYDYVAGKIALDYDETLTLDSNQLSVVVDQTYDGTSANPQSGVAIEGQLSTKQDTLVAGTDLEIINGSSVHNLPDGYTEVEYIQASGAQYIATNFIPDITKTYTFQTEVLFSILPTMYGQYPEMYFAGIRTPKRFQPVGGYSSRFVGGLGDNWTYFSDTLVANYWYPIMVTIANGSQNFNGTATSYTTNATWTSPLFLFAQPKDNEILNYAFGSMKIFKIFEASTLIHQYVPCKHGDIIGMYDTVEDEFFTNGGTGVFIAGAEVSGTTTINFTNDTGYITGIDSTDVTTALGYTPVNPSSLATVATSGDYDDLTNKPTIPTVGDGTITITQGGVTKGTFTTNQSANATIALDAGGSGGIQNTATGTDSLTILGTPTTGTCNINIGTGSQTPSYDCSIAIGAGETANQLDGAIASDYSIAIGSGYDVYNGANADANSIAIGTSSNATNYSVALGFGSAANVSGYAIALGSNSLASGASSIALGDSAEATTTYAIQLGEGSNTTSNTMQVWNYSLLDKTTGLIPDARLSSNIARTSQIPSITGYLNNTATGTDSLTILGTASTHDYTVNIGVGSATTDDYSTAIGYNATTTDGIAIGQGATVSGTDSLGIGRDVSVTGDNAIQLGYGSLSSNDTFQVWNYVLLDYPTGEIPDARLSSNIARTSQIPSVPTNISSFTNDSGYITSASLPTMTYTSATETLVFG